ncbi:hypothetical protein FBQ99_13535 [Chloroflexi bacterium CFX2]|nr:hypothetical protein [Chloroflexi bacterium CFX2]
MEHKKFTLSFLVLALIVGALAALTILFQPADNPNINRAAPTSVWSSFLQATPFAYLTPLPDPAASPLDGLYTKVDPSWPQWWKCLRCADYRAAGGIWKLQFDKGVMRIFYEVNGWRSISSYTVEGDRLYLFNDPYCPEHVGEYEWSLTDGQLELRTVNDPCSFDLRAENLSGQSWSSCAADDAPGCTEKRIAQTSIIPAGLSVSVEVFGGDSRFFASPPDLYAHANAEDMSPPEGIQISYAEEAIPYGLHRVIWWNGDWIEAVVNDDSFTAMGVQILGEQAIGWARVLFDGEEVWRGDTAAIWEKSGRHGGYIQVSGFEPGRHVLRVEALGFDYRPVTVASFGFSKGGGVSP